MSIASKILGMIPWGRARSQATATAQLPAEPVVKFPIVAGSQPEWLRVLNAEQLLTLVQASKALKEIYRQSRQSQILWERDLLPAIYRYAEFVQLMPASEAHHHAHAGGLLSHTIEMVLASMTFRNAHLLPEGSAIEVIDHQRDHWTYVVFFAALLHDIAKPMTDLRIQWRCDGMADSIRWVAGSGSLAQITNGRALPEYLVGFAPKSQRDYSAHSKLAQLLLPSIAPPTALSFLASQPEALDLLQNYLSGNDKESLVAKIVKRADKLSTQRALLSGNRMRFASAKAVPLIDLLMQAISSMLRAGTALPLNRTGATGWVFDGAVWFVAKRLADLVRDWIRTHEPDEAIPGEAKNDRLFDTWQEYGVVAPAAQSHETGAGTRPAQPAIPSDQRASTLLCESGAIAEQEPVVPPEPIISVVSNPDPKPKPASKQTTPLRVSREMLNLVDMLDELPQVMPRTAVTRPTGSGSNEPQPVLLVQELPKIPGADTKPEAEPSELALEFMQWVQQGLVQRTIKFNETGAVVHFVPEGMALVSPKIFKDFAAATDSDGQAHELGAKVQREVIKCGWHLPAPNRTNIIKYEIQGRGGAVVATLSCVVLVNSGKWVQPIPPSNPALRMA